MGHLQQLYMYVYQKVSQNIPTPCTAAALCSGRDPPDMPPAMEDSLPSRFQGCDKRHKLRNHHGDSRTRQHRAQVCYTWDCTDHTCRVVKFHVQNRWKQNIAPNKTIGHIIILSGSHPHASAAKASLWKFPLLQNHPIPMFEPTGGKPNQRFACFYVFRGVKGVGWGGVGW